MIRADAVRNRERVLIAARDAFARDGLGASIDDIARAAGVGAGTVYRHFPTKESLYEAVLTDRVESLIGLARSFTDGEGLFTFVAGFGDAGGGNRALAEALNRRGLDIHARLGELSEDLKAAVSELLALAQREGTARDDVTPEDLHALLAAVHLAAERSGADELAARRMLGVLADGLRRR